MSEYTCKGCGRDFSHKGKYASGSLRLHQLSCKKYKELQEQEGQPQQENTCPEGKHEWRLLNKSVPAEKRAYDAGKREVCDACLELR